MVARVARGAMARAAGLGADGRGLVARWAGCDRVLPWGFPGCALLEVGRPAKKASVFGHGRDPEAVHADSGGNPGRRLCNRVAVAGGARGAQFVAAQSEPEPGADSAGNIQQRFVADDFADAVQSVGWTE